MTEDQAPIEGQLFRRRAAAAAAWNLDDAILVIGAGDPLSVPGRGDLTYPYRAHSEYLYLTDRNRPGGVLAFDPSAGWVDFVAPVTTAERLWSGATELPHDGARPLPELERWLAARAGRPVAALGAPIPGTPGDPTLTEDLRLALSVVRRPKDEVELDRMRSAERATAAGFAAAVAALGDGVTEREVQIELERAAFRHGAAAMAYDTIVGAGSNAAVLHFPPSERRLRDGDLVLIDAGAEYRGYASDITRTYCVGGTMTAGQAELHALVRAAEQAAIERCTPGTEWRDVHLTAATVIAEGLVAFGLLRGEPTALVESGAVWLLFPHGIGHLLGLGVRDAGDPLPERRSDPPPYANLRIDLPLAAGFVVTVEPGIYFVPALINDPERRRAHRGEVDFDRAERMLEFGGIRIEDNVLIGDGGHEVLTADVPLLG